MTTSLELSKKLYEKGLEIETEKIWALCMDKFSTQYNSGVMRIVYTFGEMPKDRSVEWYPAYQTDELLEILPKATNQDDWQLEICTEFETYWRIQYKNVHTNFTEVETQDKIFPEALGKMCFWLLENGYIYNKEQRCLKR